MNYLTDTTNPPCRKNEEDKGKWQILRMWERTGPSLAVKIILLETKHSYFKVSTNLSRSSNPAMFWLQLYP
jgi:hypothetical protein